MVYKYRPIHRMAIDIPRTSIALIRQCGGIVFQWVSVDIDGLDWTVGDVYILLRISMEGP